MKGRTTMVIAHRLSTIRDSSKIVAFDKGKVFEEGTHCDLLNREGSLYRKLWHRQLSKGVYEEEEEEEEEEERMDEEEVVQPLPVEAGMNPKPGGLRRLEALLRDIDDSDPKKKEVKTVCDMLKKEEESHKVRGRGIQRGSIEKWKGHAENDANVGTKNLKRLANKMIFKKMHSEVSEKLQSLKKEN